MHNNCSMIQLILALIILVCALWWNSVYANWVIALAALGLILHSAFCKACKYPARHETMTAAPVAHRRKRL